VNLNYSTRLAYAYQDCDIHRQNHFEVVWRSSVGSVAERCCTVYVIERMKKARPQHHYQRAGETRDYCVRGPPDDDANNNQHQTGRGSCSLCCTVHYHGNGLIQSSSPYKVTCSTTIRSPRCWYIEEYTFSLRKPQKISISELHLPILHVIWAKHAIIS
jgi:hypothetical protein